MIHGFDESLTCEGIVGDGCGGGRLFTIQDEKLKAYDPQSEKFIILLEDVKDATAISKKACVVTITCKGQIIEFDLSSKSKNVIKK